jgi:hypothetical protein
MKSIVTTYPYFQSLPKGIKMMLVESEEFFFDEISSRARMVVTPVPVDSQTIQQPWVGFAAGVDELSILTGTDRLGHAHAVEPPIEAEAGQQN